MLTNLYIDGFNLYNRAVKKSPRSSGWTCASWPRRSFPLMTSNASAISPPSSSHAPTTRTQTERQDNVSAGARHAAGPGRSIFGEFRERIKHRPLASPKPGRPAYVRIRDTEEKGSDVNLATRLLVGGFTRDYQQAVVVSNDSDLASPIRYVSHDLELRVVVVNPDARTSTHNDLVESATYVRRIWKSHLRKSQLPPTVTDEHGVITKPAGW